MVRTSNQSVPEIAIDHIIIFHLAGVCGISIYNINTHSVHAGFGETPSADAFDHGAAGVT